MARNWNGSTNFTSTASAVVTTYPITFAGWGYLTALTQNRVILNANTSSGATFHYFSLGVGTTGIVKADVNATNAAINETSVIGTSTEAGNSWFHIAAVFASTSDIRVYKAGVQEGSGTTAHTPAGIVKLTLGAYRAAGTGASWIGRIAHMAAWTAALTDDEVGGLGKGVSPLLVRPESLAGYWPFWGARDPEPDYRELYNVSVGGVAKSEGPALVQPSTVLAVDTGAPPAFDSALTTRFQYPASHNTPRRVVAF